ncbi:hypothetical protein HK104_008062 [Borealophlyctis nickersoniae]|nr:hypothetical protein HK104_008062 [Borealophlyctis nickersoniae]
MYSPQSVRNNAVEADELYVQKLRNSINEMNIVKETAIRTENYALADQTRNKVISLQAQLVKMEHQLNADILTNCVTRWQDDLAGVVTAQLAKLAQFRQPSISPTFLLKDKFHENFLQIIRMTPPNYYDSMIRSLLLILPQDIPDMPKSPYGFDFFMRKVSLPVGLKREESTLDVIKMTVVLGVLDALMELTAQMSSNDFTRDTLRLVLRHAFFYLRAAAFRRFGELEGKLFEQIIVRWSIILGDVAVVERATIVEHIGSILDVGRKATPEEIVVVLSAARYISATPQNEGDAAQILHYMRDLSSHFDKAKKTVVKLAIIQAIERLVQPLDFTKSAIQEPWEVALYREVLDLHKRSRKWATSEDLRGPSLRLAVIILVNSPLDYFNQHIHAFITTDLCPKPKLKPHVYGCLLQLLRGRYYLDTRLHSRELAAGMFSVSEAYQYLTRAPEEESPDVVTARLKEIADILFVRRKGLIGAENLDVCADIVVQMAVHNLQVSLKLISHLLETHNTEGSVEIFYIGTRALRIILDPDSGFATSAATRDPQFPYLLGEVPFEFEANLAQMLHVCDHHVGIPALGKAGAVLEPQAWDKGKGKAEPPRSSFDGLAENDMISLLSEAIDPLSLGDDDRLDMDRSSGEIGGRRETTLNRGMTRSAGDVVRPSTLTRPMSMRRPVGAQQADGGGGAEGGPKGTNAKVTKAITGWLTACDLPTADVERLTLTSMLVEPGWATRRQPKLKPDQQVVLRLFKEVIRLVPFMPAPELVSGQWFVGTYLIHVSEEVAREVSFSLQRIFVTYPEMRLSIINGFLNYLKSTPHQDDISLCTVLLHLAFLINIWAKEGPLSERQDPDIIYRVSCKLDAATMVFLARPNARIRKTCLQALEDFYSIQERATPHMDGPGDLPLHAVMVRTESIVTKHAVYAFLENDLFGHLLVPKITAGLDTVSIRDVALSDFTVLWRFYLGELARQYAHYGRPKALRHTAKFLRHVAVPYMTSLSSVTPEFVATYAAYIVLLMALGGVPEVSEVAYPQQPQSHCDNLLFNEFKGFLAPILNSDNAWEVKAVVSSSYFVHRSIVQYYVTQLWEWFNELRRGGPGRLNPRMLDNALTALRCITQAPDFEYLVQEPTVFPTPMTETITEFLQSCDSILNDVNFLTTGPVYRIKTATNYCVIVQRLAEGLQSERVANHRALVQEGRLREGDPLPEVRWDAAVRLAIMGRMKEWYSLIQEVGAVVAGGPDKEKMAHYRVRLMEKVGMAAEKLMALGDVFGGQNVPPDTLNWLVALESSDHRVITPTLLYNYENALGTVLAQAYSGRGNSPNLFIEPIFDQVLPRANRGPHLFLSGDDTRITTTEDYVSTVHALPLRPNMAIDEYAALVFPLIDEDAAMKLRQNIGSLIYFGCYNMLHTDKSIRNRAFLFVRELFLNFNPDPSFDVEGFFAKHTGAFYTSVSHHIKPKIIDISALAADLFPGDAPSFLWEAVRSSRSAQKSEKQLTLIPTQQWVLELIVPWCRYIDLANTEEDVVNTEVFRFMMDSAFYKPTPGDYVLTCWEEAARSADFGEANAAVFTDVLVHVCGRLEKLRDQALALQSRLFLIHPDRVTSSLAYHLSSEAFPWKKTAARAAAGQQPPVRPWTPVVKDYISVLQSALNGSGSTDGINEYTTTCKSAVMLISELLVQNFATVSSYLPVLMNYVLLHLPPRLQEDSVSTYLLQALVEGYIGMLHASGRAAVDEVTDEKLRRLLVLLGTTTCYIDWECDYLGPDPPTPEDGFVRVPVAEFLDTLISIFEKDYQTLQADFAAETLNWASEGFLGPEHTVRAVETYTMLVNNDPSTPMDRLDPLTSRLYDHVGILISLEQDALSKRGGGGELGPQDVTDGWEALPEGKKTIRANTEKVLTAVLRLHQNLIVAYGKAGSLLERPHLFWSAVALLNLPSTIFPSMYALALDNCRLYLSSIPRSSGSVSPDSPFLVAFESISKGFPGLQPILLQGLFNEEQVIQDKSFDLLLTAWCVVPDYVVDPNPVAMLYTVLYSLTWLFANILAGSEFGGDGGAVSVDGIASQLKDALTAKRGYEFTGMIRCLQSICDDDRNALSDPNRVNDLLEKCTANIAQVFVPEYINNIADFFSQVVQLGPTYGRTVLRMLSVLWSLSGTGRGRRNMAGFKQLVKRLPFLRDNAGEANALIAFILKEAGEVDDDIKEVDLTSQGRIDALPVVDIPPGSARAAGNCLADLGIRQSNAMYQTKSL